MFRTMLLSILLFMVMSAAVNAQEMQSTIVDLRKNAETLAQISTENYRRPVDDIKKTLRENVGKAVKLRKQLDEQPDNFAAYAEFESVVSSTLSELDQQMSALLEGKPAMDEAIGKNLEAVSKIRKQLTSQSEKFRSESDSQRQAATQVDNSLDHASDKLAPLLKSGAELPLQVEAHIRKLMVDFKIHDQKSKLAELSTKELLGLNSQLKIYEQSLRNSQAKLDVSYHTIAAQRTLLSSLAGYRAERASSRQMTRELGSFAKGIGELTSAIEGIDITVVGDFADENSSSVPTLENVPTERLGADELLRRRNARETQQSVVKKDKQ